MKTRTHSSLAWRVLGVLVVPLLAAATAGRQAETGKPLG